MKAINIWPIKLEFGKTNQQKRSCEFNSTFDKVVIDYSGVSNK